MKALVSIVALATGLIVASMTLAADAPSQPLTRFACDRASMHWNEEANVCAAPNLTAAMPQSSTAFAADINHQPLLVSSSPSTRPHKRCRSLSAEPRNTTGAYRPVGQVIPRPLGLTLPRP